MPVVRRTHMREQAEQAIAELYAAFRANVARALAIVGEPECAREGGVARAARRLAAERLPGVDRVKSGCARR